MLAAVRVPVALIVLALVRRRVVVGGWCPGRAVPLAFVSVLTPLAVCVPQVRGAAFVRRLRLTAFGVCSPVP